MKNVDVVQLRRLFNGALTWDELEYALNNVPVIRGLSEGTLVVRTKRPVVPEAIASPDWLRLFGRFRDQYRSGFSRFFTEKRFPLEPVEEMLPVEEYSFDRIIEDPVEALRLLGEKNFRYPGPRAVGEHLLKVMQPGDASRKRYIALGIRDEYRCKGRQVVRATLFECLYPHEPPVVRPRHFRRPCKIFPVNIFLVSPPKPTT